MAGKSDLTGDPLSRPTGQGVLGVTITKYYRGCCCCCCCGRLRMHPPELAVPMVLCYLTWFNMYLFLVPMLSSSQANTLGSARGSSMLLLDG